MTKKIGYLAQVYPYLSMTFVYREVLALRRKGVQIDTFSTWKPSIDELSAEAKPLVEETYYIFPIQWMPFIIAHLYFIFLRPMRYWGTLAYLLSRPHASLKNWFRTLFHFGEAVPLAREAKRRQIHHMHVHFALNATTMAMIVERLTGISYSFTAHANDIFANPILLAEKIENARFIVAISNFNARFLAHYIQQDGTVKKTSVVRCGIDVSRFAPPNRSTLNERPLILAAARLVEKKGFPYLIRACNELVERSYAFDCVIMGGGPQEDLLKELIQKYSLEDFVRLTGPYFQEEILDYFERADIFALPCIVAKDNDMDGIPNSLMEGMAMEIPSVSTTVSGIPELIEHMETGLLVPPEDATSLADALALLLDDSALRRRLGMAGRRKVADEYELEANTGQLLNVFMHHLGSDIVVST